MIYPAALTPRRSSGVAIDIAAALELLAFLESKGVDGITLLGSTGEFLHFEAEDRARFAAMAIKRCRVPVLVNAAHSTFDGALALAAQALDSGAAGVLVTPPYYYRYSQDSIRAFFLEFANQAKGPVWIYNIPQFAPEIKLPTILDLLSSRAFAGIKDSSGIWENFESIHAAGHKIFLGADAMYSRTARHGAYGSISGTASVVPELMLTIDRRARAGEDTSEQDAALQQYLQRVSQFPFPIAYREAAMLRGLKLGPHATPLSPADCQLLEEFKSWFRQWLPSVTS